MTRNPVVNNRARWQGWTPSRRDRFEQWLCRRLDDTPDLYICRAAWFGWLDQQWRDWQDMQRELGIPSGSRKR